MPNHKKEIFLTLREDVIGTHGFVVNQQMLKLLCNNSEFTQQDSRKKRMAKCLCVTNVTGLLLACFVVTDLHLTLMFSIFYKKICLKEDEV